MIKPEFMGVVGEGIEVLIDKYINLPSSTFTIHKLKQINEMLKSMPDIPVTPKYRSYLSTLVFDLEPKQEAERVNVKELDSIE